MHWPKRRDDLTEQEFQQRYRLTKTVFARVVVLLIPYLLSDRRMTGMFSPIPVELQLSMTLRFLAGGSHLDIMDLHGVGYSTFYRCLWRTCYALDKCLPMSFNVADEDEMAQLEDGFARLTRHVLRGIVGAIDGLAVKIIKPHICEVPDPMAYYNRKGFFALNVQAICDSQRRFRWFSAATCGSTHDATAFAATRLSRRLGAGQMGEKWCIAADEAYGLGEHLVTPYSGRNLSVAKDSYNFYQSRCRINIECAFGILVRRWGILWRKMEISLDKVPLVVGVCMKLHNLCIDHRLEVMSCFEDGRWGARQGRVNTRAPDGPFVYIQDECALELVAHRRHREVSIRRDSMCAALDLAGLRRPAIKL